MMAQIQPDHSKNRGSGPARHYYLFHLTSKVNYYIGLSCDDRFIRALTWDVTYKFMSIALPKVY